MSILLTESQLVDEDAHFAKNRFKLIVTGSKNVGKSALIRRLDSNTFEEKKSEDRITKALARVIQGAVVRSDVQEVGYDVFERDEGGFLKQNEIDWLDVKGIIVMYDINSKESYNELKRKLPLVQNTVAPNCDICLVGSKADCEREVPFELADRLAEQMDLSLFEISSKTNINCEAMLVEVLDKIIERREAELEHWQEIRSNQPVYEDVVEPSKPSEEQVPSNPFCWIPRIPFISKIF
ncbi:unnamed protein product [Caenorhabditis auriculariae]|uniref:Uncharacterized protein n=1 Tax=Caenorhabditis auriculariae TaxID=2777116 RepID=A0A8S1GWF7_9PELO|nr:unnamed protein product [Caenorhabditis auriculariae]